ncbi:MAG: peroxiredoxin [Candidatus Eisenbacteria bacterium]
MSIPGETPRVSRPTCFARARVAMERMIQVGGLALALTTSAGAAEENSASGAAPQEKNAAKTASVTVRAESPEANLLAVGSIAPDFTLRDQGNRVVTASALWKDAPVVLYFYPADFTPGCTVEAHAFEEERPKIEALGARLLGVSVNEVPSHARFAEHCGVHFAMLADTSAAVAQLYGTALTLQQEHGTRTIARRVTYLIGNGGEIWQRWIVGEPSLHPGEVRAALEAKQPGARGE